MEVEMEMDMDKKMEMGTDLALGDEDPDRRPTTLLGRIRRFFDRGPRATRCHDWFDNHPAGAHWGGWGWGGGGWDCGSGGGYDGGGCGGGDGGSC
jgi:hypothetical protein